MPEDPRVSGRPVQWSDLQTHQRKIVSDNIRETGENLPKIAHESAERMQATHERTGNAKAGIQSRSLGAVAPHLQSKPVTLQTAANSRQKLYNAGIEDRRAANPGDEHQVIPTGAGWYFKHHQEIAEGADRHGVPRDWAIAASGVMSPMNSPENEVASVHAIMDANANHKVTVTPEVHDHLAKNGIDASDHLGKTVHFDQLPTGSVAALSDKSIRSKVPTTADLQSVARGGVRGNITKAEKLLAGEVHPDDAADPHSAPKVWSYIHNTRQAVPNSDTHVEFMGRVHQDALVRNGQIDKHQQALDLYGHQDKPLPKDHLLSPESHTVEDTWQNAATFDQPKKTVGRASVFKAAGSMPETYPVRGVKTRVNEETGKKESAHTDARVGPSAITHAFNNKATQKAAAQQGRGSGTTVPPVAMQEVGWVQMRKEAGKDSEFNNQVQEKPDPYKGEVRGQMALFGDHVPGGQHAAHREEHPDMTPGQMEKDLRAHEAIHSARRMRDRRLRSQLDG